MNASLEKGAMTPLQQSGNTSSSIETFPEFSLTLFFKRYSQEASSFFRL